MLEVWKDIDGYEGRYQISNMGRVRTLDYNHTGQIQEMKVSFNGKGYLQVCLTKNNKRKSHKIHRLVAEAFIENTNPSVQNQVNHIDEDKTNNAATNLEWCTNFYNLHYGSRISKTAKEIAQIDLDGNVVKIWASGKEIERVTGYCRRVIGRCCDGKTKSAYGFKWVKANERGQHLRIS